MLQKLPIGIQTFSEIINEDYLYIDKTEVIHRLITSGKYFFLYSSLAGRRFLPNCAIDTMAIRGTVWSMSTTHSLC